MLLGDRLQARVPILRPGLALLAVYVLWFVLQEAGLVRGSQESLLTIALTGAGWAVAWGFLLAGAAAGGWGVRILVTVALGLSLVPSAGVLLLQGSSGWVLLAALGIFLTWRWRREWDGPAQDLLGSGVIILLIYGVLADRSLLLRQYHVDEMAGFIALVMDTEVLVISLYAGGILVALGGLLGDIGGGVAGRLSVRLARLPAPLLAAAGALACLGKIGWAVSRDTSPAWLTAAALAAAMAAWLWLSRPQAGDAWPDRQPLPLLWAGFVLVSLTFGWSLLFRELEPISFGTAIRVTGGSLLLAGAAGLVLGRRGPARLAGLAGLWLLLMEGGAGLERLTPAVIDGLLHLLLLGWTAWLWARGGRASAAYGLVCGAVLWLLALDGLNWLLEQAPEGPLYLGIFLLVALYGLVLLVVEAARAGERQGVALAGLGLGGALLLFTAASWGRLSDVGEIYAPSGLPVLGYALLAPPVLLYSLLRHAHQMEGRSAHE